MEKVSVVVTILMLIGSIATALAFMWLLVGIRRSRVGGSPPSSTLLFAALGAVVVTGMALAVLVITVLLNLVR